MWCARGKNLTPEEKQAHQTSQDIEKGLKQEAKSAKQKLLLLGMWERNRTNVAGTGDAGKSTFCRQMLVIHSEGLRNEEVMRFADVLRDNTLVSMQTVLMAANEWDLSFVRDCQPLVSQILHARTDLTPELAATVAQLAQTDVVKYVLSRSNELQIPGGGSGAEYYFENCERFADPEFVPTTEDIMRAKLRTTGIVEVNFSVVGSEFTMVDVGGQRSERRKWLHCFGDVTAVIFLVAINEYDMVLEEDNKTNRMEESLKLFQKLSGSQWFETISFVLFLNKSDLFEKKIQVAPLRETFVDYDEFVQSHAALKDATDEVRGFEYIKSQYASNFAGLRLYTYKTCAIDRDNCKKVFEAIKDTILSVSLKDVGI
jgi:GTPase SAR1 family protein